MRKVRWTTWMSLIFVIVMFGACQTSSPSPVPRKVIVIASGQSRLSKLAGLRQGLTDRGYRENVDYTITLYDAKNQRDRIPILVKQALNESPTLLVTLGGIETQTAKQLRHAETPPIVFIGVADTVHWGVVDSFQNPGHNLTGVDNQYVELTGKRLEYMTFILPTARRILLLYSEHIVPSKAAQQAAEQAASKLGLELIPYSVNQVDDLTHITDIFSSQKIDAILVVPSFILENAAPSILVPQARERCIPIIGLNDDATSYGALFSYGASFFDMGYQASRLVDKVFQGTPAGQIPAEYPDIPRLSLNTAVAQQCDMSIPREVLPLVDTFFHEVAP